MYAPTRRDRLLMAFCAWCVFCVFALCVRPAFALDLTACTGSTGSGANSNCPSTGSCVAYLVAAGYSGAAAASWIGAGAVSANASNGTICWGAVASPTCTGTDIWNSNATFCVSGTLTCTSPQVLNSGGTACVDPALTCTSPQVPNTAGTACVDVVTGLFDSLSVQDLLAAAGLVLSSTTAVCRKILPSAIS